MWEPDCRLAAEMPFRDSVYAPSSVPSDHCVGRHLCTAVPNHIGVSRHRPWFDGAVRRAPSRGLRCVKLHSCSAVSSTGVPNALSRRARVGWSLFGFWAADTVSSATGVTRYAAGLIECTTDSISCGHLHDWRWLARRFQVWRTAA